MATVLKFNKQSWTNAGLQPSEFDVITLAGFTPAWKGKGFTLVDNDGESWGLASLDGDKNFAGCDTVFGAKAMEALGHPLTFPGDTPKATKKKKPFVKKPLSDGVKVKVINIDDHVEAEPVPKPKSEWAKKPKPNPVDHIVKLADAEAAGQKVFGTSSGSVYTTYLVADNVRVAYRRNGNALSIRAEGFDDDTEKKLADWGLSPKSDSDGKRYASAHVEVTGDEAIRRVLGSLAFSVVGSVIDHLPAEEIA